MSTIYEVATRARVSTATVSRVLQAIQQLGYEPNSTAKNLRTLKTGKLIVSVPDISNPFFSLILQGIEAAAQREGYSVLVGDTSTMKSARKAAR